MSVSKVKSMLFICFVSLLYINTAFSQIKTNQLDKTNPTRFIYENPLKAIALSLDSSNKSISEVQKHSIACRAYVQLGDLARAQTHLDSIISESKKVNSPSESIHLIKAQVALLVSKGEKDVLTRVLADAKRDALNQKNNQLLVEILLIESDQLRSNKQLDETFAKATEALTIAIQSKQLKQAANASRAVGSILYMQSHFTDAIKYYEMAIDYSSQANDTVEMLMNLRNISLVKRDMGLNSEAISVLNSSIKLATQSNNNEELASIYNLLGSIKVREGNANDALSFYVKSIKIREEEELLLSLASTLENLSRVQRDMNQFDDALKSLERSIQISTELNEQQRLGAAYNELGNLYAQQDNLADALRYYLVSLKIRQQANVETEISRSLTNIGITYRRLGSHQNARKYFTQALDLIPSESDPIGKAYVHINLGNSLIDLGEINGAIENYSKAVELRKKSANQLLVAQAMRSLANGLVKASRVGEARAILNKTLAISQNLKDEKFTADILNDLGNAAQLELKYQDALNYFNQAFSIYNQNQELVKKGLCLRKMGEIQTILGMFALANKNLETALDISYKANNIKLRELTLLALHDFYLARNQHKEALFVFKQHIQVRDSINAETQKESIWQVSLELELDKKAQEIKKIENEVEALRIEGQLKSIQLKQQTLTRNFLVIVLLFIFILAFVSIYGFVAIRNKNKKLNLSYQDLAQSQVELKRTLSTRDKLFSIIAHDLKSPFTALVGLSEILSIKAHQLNRNEVEEYSGLIQQSSQNLLGLIENLLHWSRSQTGKINLTPKQINLYDLVEDVLSVVRIQANSKRIETVNSVPNQIHIFADYDTMSTAIRNLASNAVKFTPVNGNVTVGAKVQESRVIITITDSGVGISNENISKLFEVDKSFSTKGTCQESGTGLGLIICKEFIEKNGGAIAVESELDRGTIFTLSLPIEN